MNIRIAPVLASALAIAALGACGSDADKAADPTTTVAGATTTAPTTTDTSEASTTTASSGDQAKNTIGVKGLSFVPSELTIAAGESVTFANPEGFQHTVVPDVEGSFVGADRDAFAVARASHTVEFPTAGTFKFHCGIHGSSMSGTITVTA